MQSSIFLILFHNRRWTNNNGDSVVMQKTGNGSYTTHGENNFLPVQYYFDLINNGTIIIANNGYFSAKITQIDAKWSNYTKQLTLTFQVNKQHIHQKGWQEDQVPKSMPGNEDESESHSNSNANSNSN